MINNLFKSWTLNPLRRLPRVQLVSMRRFIHRIHSIFNYKGRDLSFVGTEYFALIILYNIVYELFANSNVLLGLLKSLDFPEDQEGQEVGLHHVVEVAPPVLVPVARFDTGQDSRSKNIRLI